MRRTSESSRAVAVPVRRDFCNERRLAEQSTLPGDDLTAACEVRLQPERALLYDEGAIGGVAGAEQHFATLDRIVLGADGKNAQRRRAEPPQNRDPFKERDIVVDTHDNRRSRHKFVAAGFSDKDGGGCGIFLDLLPQPVDMRLQRVRGDA